MLSGLIRTATDTLSGMTYRTAPTRRCFSPTSCLAKRAVGTLLRQGCLFGFWIFYFSRFSSRDKNINFPDYFLRCNFLFIFLFGVGAIFLRRPAAGCGSQSREAAEDGSVVLCWGEFRAGQNAGGVVPSVDLITWPPEPDASSCSHLLRSASRFAQISAVLALIAFCACCCCSARASRHSLRCARTRTARTRPPRSSRRSWALRTKHCTVSQTLPRGLPRGLPALCGRGIMFGQRHRQRTGENGARVPVSRPAMAGALPRSESARFRVTSETKSSRV